jgi:hypothetical protein
MILLERRRVVGQSRPRLVANNTKLFGSGMARNR